jgi:hypothetical protein
MEYWNIGKTENRQQKERPSRFALSVNHSIIPEFHPSRILSFISSIHPSFQRHKKRSVRKTTLLVFCSLVFVFLGGAEVQAITTTATAVGGGTWATATWSAGVPTNADDAVINSGVTLTIGTAAVCASLTIGNATNSNTTLTVGAGGSLSVTTAGGGTGNLVINPNNLGRTMRLAVDTRSATIEGTVTLSASGTTNIRVTTGSASFTRAAGITLSNGSLTLTSTGTVTFTGLLTQSGGTISNTTTAGTFEFDGGFTKTGGTFTTMAGETLKFGGSLTVSNSVLTFDATSLAQFDGSATVTPTAAITFGNVQIDSGVTVTLAGSIAVAGNWTNNGGTLSGGSNTVTFSGASKTIGGTGGTAFPNVTIAAGASYSLNTGTTNSCNNLVFTASGTASSLTHTGSASFSVDGNLTINQPTAAVTTAWNINAGTGSVTGTTTINATNTTSTRVASVNVTSGSATFTDTVTLNTGTSSATAQINVGTGSATFSSAFSMNEATLAFSGAGTINFGGGYSFVSGGSATPVFTTVSGANLTFGNALTVSATGGLTLNAGSNSTFTGSGNITPTTNLTMGNVTVNNGVTATTQSAAGTFTIAGNLALNGTGTLAGAEDVLLTGSAATLDGSGTLSAASTVSAAHTVLSTANLTISGTMTINNGITVTNNGTVTASNLGAGTGTWLQNASTAVLNYSGSSITPTLTAATNGNTVNYNANGAQSVKQTNYYHLQLSTSGTKTFASTTTGIAGNMAIGGTATADATTNSTTIDYNGGGAQNVGAINYYNLTLSNAGLKTFSSGTTGIANTFTIGGTASADATTNTTTIDYNRGGAQNVVAINYYNLTLSTSGTKTFASTTTGIANTFTISGSASADATTNSATIDYNGSGAQSVTAINYHHLSISNGGTKTLPASASVAGNLATSGTATASCSGNLTVNGNVTVGSGTSFNGGSGTIDVDGDLTASGTSFTSTSGNLYVGGDFSVTGGSFTHSSGTIILDGSDKYISASGVALNNLQASGPRAISLGSSLTAQGTVSVTSGYLVQDLNYNLWAGAINVGANGGYRNWGTGTLTLGGNVSNSGTIFFNGGGDGNCGSATEALIRSSVDGTRRLWSGSGTFNMVDVDVKDQGGTASITVYHGTSTGGNNDTNWTFNDTCTGAPTAIKLVSFSAMSSETGEVLLSWRTGYEVDNLGFHIYREENGELFRVTPELIAGSAFLTGTGTPLTAGRSYQWVDASASADAKGPSRTAGLEDRPFWTRGAAPKGDLEAVASNLKPQATLQAERSLSHAEGVTVAYWLEDWDLSGKKTMHGPVTPVRSQVPLLKYANPTLLSNLGKRQNQKYGEFWRIQEIREKLLKDHPAGRGKRTAPLEDRPAEAGLEEHPRETGIRGAAPKGGLEAVPSNLEPQVTPEAERSLIVSPPAQRSLRAAQTLASRPGVKIGVREQGWYRVTQPDLVAAGLDPWVDPRRLQLFVDGKEQAILVPGEDDGRLDPADSIEFYGVGLDTPFTDTRIYWLIEGTRAGKRIKTKQSGTGGAASQSFPYTVEIKERTIYFAALQNGDTDNFFGAIVSSAGVDQILNLKNLDPSASGNALLEVAIQGGTSVSHRVKVFVNDVQVVDLRFELTEMRFEGTERRVMIVPIPHSWLTEGENLVSLVAQGGQSDVSVVDYIRLTYWRTYAAEEDSLRFSSSAGRQVVITGFTDPGIRVVDITKPTQVQEITGLAVEPEGQDYTVRFRTTGTGIRTLLAFTEGVIKSPVSITVNQPSTWYASGNWADLVIISHKDFMASLEPLKSLRESQGWSVALIDVEDIYDEFNLGAKTPQALRDFLQRARASWKRPPQFVLLVGDASFDPRNYLGLGDYDFVPTKLVDTLSSETASDDWFVDFNDSGLPTLATGRIPVRTVEEAALVVSKIIAYENAEAGAWTRQVLTLADKMDGEDPFDFEWASRKIETLLPVNVAVEEIFRSQTDDETVRTRIIDSVNEGRLLVNYIGHGSVEVWRGGVFSSDDVPTLANGARLPFFITMTCLNGYFHDAFPSESLAESLLKAEGGGAVAVWASSGFTEPEGQALMNKKLISLLFDGKSRTLGEATMKAKAATKDVDVQRTWILFGDPTTRLKQ